ncbi:MAG: glycosyltransferase family 4 protein, partial [Cyanobacteria bacterium J06642_11]
RQMIQQSDAAVAIVPPVLDPKKWDAIATTPMELPATARKFLYVGRVVPHKKIEDLIQLYGEYFALDSDSSLLIAGFNGFHAYTPTLEAALDKQPEAVKSRIHFLGSVTDGQLKFLYEQVDAFWMMSEHEGFCIPLLEAMAFDLPVFAFAQTAVRETLGEAGIAFYQKDMSQLAQAVHEIMVDPDQHHQLLTRQRQRCQQLTLASDGRAIWQLLESCLHHIYASSV